MRTLLKKTTLITSLMGFMCALIGVSCQSSPPPTLTKTNIPISSATNITATNTLVPTETASPVSSPTNLPETSTPIPSPTISPSKTPKPCAWRTYADDKTSAGLNNGSCSSVQGITISEDEKELSFFTNLAKTVGTYGVCQDVSNKDSINFDVIIENSITSVRFFIMISPDANPTTKFSQGFKIQPNMLAKGKKDISIKFTEYVSDNNRSDYGGMEAIPEWLFSSQWKFNFVFKFDATQVDASMNDSLPKKWILNANNRFLCFAYQQMPDAAFATNLDIKVLLP